MQRQLSFLDEANNAPPDREIARSGTFADNLSLPVHRWFRYSAGFAAQWVERVLTDWRIGSGDVVLDPFAGSGTVCIVCDTLDIASIGLEAHPFVSRIFKAKTLWAATPSLLARFASEVLADARNRKADIRSYPDLIRLISTPGRA